MVDAGKYTNPMDDMGWIFVLKTPLTVSVA